MSFPEKSSGANTAGVPRNDENPRKTPWVERLHPRDRPLMPDWAYLALASAALLLVPNWPTSWSLLPTLLGLGS